MSRIVASSQGADRVDNSRVTLVMVYEHNSLSSSWSIACDVRRLLWHFSINFYIGGWVANVAYKALVSHAIHVSEASQFCGLQGLIFPNFCYLRSKIAIIPTIDMSMIPTMFTGKHVKLLKIIALVFYNLCNTACILESETNKASSKTDIQIYRYKFQQKCTKNIEIMVGCSCFSIEQSRPSILIMIIMITITLLLYQTKGRTKCLVLIEDLTWSKKENNRIHSYKSGINICLLHFFLQNLVIRKNANRIQLQYMYCEKIWTRYIMFSLPNRKHFGKWLEVWGGPVYLALPHTRWDYLAPLLRMIQNT